MKQKFTFKGIGLSLLLSFLFLSSFGQTAITDSGSCVSHTLHATVIGTVPTSSGITADDSYSGLIPIGFTFNYYGTAYTQLVIGANGKLNFTASAAGSGDGWSITSSLLGNTSALNCICGPWCDMCMPCTTPTGGTITYSTIGIAPNRMFAVTWCGDAMFSCTAQYTTSQVIIYETSNVIEAHIAHKTICTGWNGGYAIVGVQNAAGTAATTAPGRDYPSVWSVVAPPEAWRFIPGSPATTYSVSSIPYAPAPYATSAIYWYDSATHAYLGTGPYLTVTPVVGTTYMAVTLGCKDSTKTYFHVDPVSTGINGIPHIRAGSSTNPTECGKCDGTITLYGVNPHQIDTVIYSIGGVQQPRYVDSAHVDSTITLSNLCGGVYDYVYVKVDNCPSNQMPFTLVTPVLAISRDTAVNPTVCGYFNGWIKLYGLTPGKNYTVNYTKGGVPMPAAAGIVAPDSTITLAGLEAGTYDNFAVTINLCTALWGPITLSDPAPFPASFTASIHPGCAGDTVFVTNTSAPAGYFSYWNYDASAPMDSLHTFHVYHTEPSYILSETVVLTYNTVQSHKASCATTFTVPLNNDHHITASFTQNTDTMCYLTDIEFTNTTSSANPATYNWAFGNGDMNTSTSPTYHYPLASNDLYTTTLTATDSILGCTSVYTHGFKVIQVTVHEPNDTSVCLRDSMLMRSGDIVITGTNVTPIYTWTSSDGPATNLSNNDIQNPLFSGVGTFTYVLTVTVIPSTQTPLGCAASDDQVISSYPPITFTGVTASPQVIAYGSSIQLNANGALYYTWTPNNGTLNDPNINNPIATPTDSVTEYWVHGRTAYGCLDSTSVKVYVDFDNTVFNNNGFTPNGDGKNDQFRPAKLFKFQKLVEMRVYNRWGQLLFQTSNPEIGWDGTFNGVPQDLGTYSYELIAALPDGSQKAYKGTVTLIR